MMQNDNYFHTVAELLRTRRGEEQAITIDQIVTLTGMSSRRECEELLEKRLADFPFPLAASARGYYIPTSAEELNRYVASLRSRAMKIFLRQRTVVRKAVAAGWPRAGRIFAPPPGEQLSLFITRRFSSTTNNAEHHARPERT